MEPLTAPPGRGTDIKVIAHRGASGYAPENTMAAFSLAAGMGVSAIELDVHLSADRTPVVIHDATVERTTDGKGAVREYTFAELRRLDAGSWFNHSKPKIARPEFVQERIPSLRQAIDLARAADIGLYIEIKDPDLYPEDFEDRIVTLVRRARFERRVVLLSFSKQSVQRVKKSDLSIRTALLEAYSRKDVVSETRSVGADELAIRYNLLNPVILRTAQAEGMRVVVWTVNGRNAIRKTIALGPDGIISNYPDRVIHLLEEVHR